MVRRTHSENSHCHYCDVTLKYGTGVNRCIRPYGLQLDRMDSALPQIKSNCVQCCRKCNVRCCTIPYKWKILSGGGNFQHFDMKWCPNKLHDGGDDGDHVRNIDEFGAGRYCRACHNVYCGIAYNKNKRLRTGDKKICCYYDYLRLMPLRLKHRWFCRSILGGCEP